MKKLVKYKDGVYTHILYEKTLQACNYFPKTFLEIIEKRVAERPNSELFGTIINNKITYETTKDIYQKIQTLAVFLRNYTVEKDIIGIYSVNRVEWAISEYAGYMVNCINVPLYSTFQPEALQFALNQTKMKILFASDQKAEALYNTILKTKKLNLEYLILFDKNDRVKALYETIKIKVFYFSDIIAQRSTYEYNDRKPTENDIASICYTSGTSGVPKGVILKHGGFCTHLCGFNIAAKENLFLNIEGSTSISYLPLAHVFERICFSGLITLNGRVGFFQGNPKTIQKDYEIIKPTFIAAVPRVLNLFESKINEEIAKLNFLIRLIFNIALWFKKREVRNGKVNNWLLDTLIFNKIKMKFGNKLEYCLCGGAAIKSETLEFLQATLSCKIFQGYGLTEGLAANIVQPITCFDLNTVGVPYPTCRVRLNPVETYPEPNYGELLLNGPSITEGYYKDEEDTNKLFIEINGERWLRTGDIFKFENDRFYFVARSKELFKTSYGEYIVPEMIENYFIGGPIEDIFITGTKYSDYLCAIVFCSDVQQRNKQTLMQYINTLGERLVKDKKIVKYEIPKAIVIVNKPFIELNNGKLITPSFKKKRNEFFNYFETEIHDALNNYTKNK